MKAKISTVTPGPVLARSETGGDPNPAKGFAWIDDNPPSYDPATQTRTQSASIPVDATEVSYVVADIPIATLRAQWKTELRAQFESRGNSLVAGYAPSERETWAEQAKAAEAYQADADGDHPYLEAMVREGETVADLAALILTNRAALQTASAALIKVRREKEAAIDTATTKPDLDSGWPF